MAEALALAGGLEGRFYADPGLFVAERDRIFRKSWQFLGHSSALAAAGSMRSTDIAGRSVFAVRGADGELRAFRIVCRHRGARLVGDGGPDGCKVIECPYHGWRYGLDGQLLETPWFGETTPFDRSTLGLLPASLEIWRGLIFVALDPGEPLLDQLGAMPAHFGQARLEDMAEIGARTFVEPINWKTYVDQFTEFYHSPTVHGSDRRVGIDRFTAVPIDRGMLMTAPDDLAFYGTQWAWVWPNWTLATFRGGVKMSTIVPRSASESEVRFLFLGDSAGASGEHEQVIEATVRIFKEDAAVLRGVQANLASGMFEQPGPLHPRHERATAYFQQLVREALR